MAIEIFWRRILFQMMYANMTFVGDNPSNYQKYGIHSNIYWAMQYSQMTKAKCMQKCRKISHELPTIEIINARKLNDVTEARDSKILNSTQILH